MSYKENNSLMKIENNSADTTLILVQWIGSLPFAYDIISTNDVVFDDYYGEHSLKIGNTIMVQCGRIKSAAEIKQISDNSDTLFKLLRKLKKHDLKVSQQNNPQIKKRRIVVDMPDKKFIDNSTQTTIAFDENTMINLMQENQKLKAELFESNNIITTIYKDLKTVVNTVKKKVNNRESDECGILGSPKFENLSPKIEKTSPSCTADEKSNMIIIGHGKTTIPRHLLNQVNWHSFTSATRKLLMAVFSRETLATHTLTGKPSPAFISCDMPLKLNNLDHFDPVITGTHDYRLDTTKVADIIEIVSDRCAVSESMVRSVITTKCADENKMWKKRLEKNKDKID